MGMQLPVIDPTMFHNHRLLPQMAGIEVEMCTVSETHTCSGTIKSNVSSTTHFPTFYVPLSVMFHPTLKSERNPK